MKNVLQVIEDYISGCRQKIESPFSKLFLRAVLAGAMIALGACAGNVASHAITNVGLARVASAVVFPVGLMMIVLIGGELFTGDCLMAMSWMNKKESLLSIIRVLAVVFAGNFTGATLIALGAFASGQFNYSAGLLGAYSMKVALGKVNLSFASALVSGILCNILVCAAIIMAGAAKDVTGKLTAIFFVIMLFVVEGFEHCVANMYYITAGLLASLNPLYVQTAIEKLGLSAESLQTLTVKSYLISNLIPVTLGNIIGGAVCIGLPLVYLNLGQKKNDLNNKSVMEVA
ncbi:formate/nitrite transporter family protein [Treponema sp. C6A8]|uniref:formate/nitrite transporter family protein n=1 Tax=Treponema sp. C6A8 TaxID=1410609 RepID=UPI0005706180|nr:formate/nitrite transporter family protein [Treponema sp. C6A8]